MLDKIKTIWGEFKIAIIAAAFFAAYFIGQRKGKSDEKARQNTAVLQNLSRADMARRRLNNNDYVNRLRAKYTRK